MSTQWRLTSGRTRKGSICCWTKKHQKYSRKKFPIFAIPLVNNPVCFLSYYYQFSTHKLFFLSITSLGHLFYLPVSEYRPLFAYFFTITTFLFQLYFLNGNIFFLLQVKQRTLLNYIEDWKSNRIKYVRSNGVKASIVANFIEHHTVLVRLPSLSKKIFSKYNRTSIGYTLIDKKKYKNTKAGYWRNLGYKSIVRGVAMNPVDHPHGGRTKAIKYQRTPWGKTTMKT